MKISIKEGEAPNQRFPKPNSGALQSSIPRMGSYLSDAAPVHGHQGLNLMESSGSNTRRQDTKDPRIRASAQQKVATKSAQYEVQIKRITTLGPDCI